jgi:glycerol-3-phosphate dehydrogenase (NAD(P)+)
MNISIFGGGAWGTALAITFSQKHDVMLWVRDPLQAAKMAALRVNEYYLPNISLPNHLAIENDFKKATERATLIILATPVSGLRATLQQLTFMPNIPPLLWTCKGFEANSGLLPHCVVLSVLPNHKMHGALYGPSFAEEVAKGLPTAVTIASPNEAFAYFYAKSLSHSRLRIYANTDLIGSEIGSATKNVIAIACGVLEGLGLGLNARSALITRGLAEISSLTIAMGGKQTTLSGLSGIGDLILTCTGVLSRNRQFGIKMATGASKNSLLSELNHTVEGVQTTYEVRELAKQYQLDMPITEAVYFLLEGIMNPDDMISFLMERETKLEFSDAANQLKIEDANEGS